MLVADMADEAIGYSVECRTVRIFVTAFADLSLRKPSSRIMILTIAWFIPYGNKSSSNLYFFLLGYISVRNEI